MADLATISKIKLGENVYEIKDATARDAIKNLQAVKHFIGTTTTELTDGSTTNPITVGSDSITAISGNVAIYGKKEFLFGDDNTWHEFGDVSSLKALAYKDEVTATYTPEGTISDQTFTGDELTSTGSVTAAAEIGAPAFKGTQATLSVKGTPKGTVAVTAAAVPADGTATYTPAGTVEVTPTTATVKEVAGVGTLPVLTTSVADETLTIAFDQGTLPTTDDASVVTGATAAFTGTGTMLNGSFTGEETESTGAYTPAGAVDAPTFTPSPVQISVTGTPSGTVSKGTFTGTEATITSK